MGQIFFRLLFGVLVSIVAAASATPTTTYQLSGRDGNMLASVLLNSGAAQCQNGRAPDYAANPGEHYLSNCKLTNVVCIGHQLRQNSGDCPYDFLDSARCFSESVNPPQPLGQEKSYALVLALSTIGAKPSGIGHIGREYVQAMGANPIHFGEFYSLKNISCDLALYKNTAATCRLEIESWDD